MCYSSLAANMSTNSKPPRYQRQQGYNNAFMRDSPKKRTTVFSDIRTILIILKATGLFPIYVELTNFEIGPPTKPNEFYSFFVRGVVHAFTVFNLYSLFTREYSNLFYSYRDTENINQWVEILLFIFTYTLTIFVCARNSKAFLKLMNEILKVDNEVFNQYGVVLSNNCGFSVKYLVGISLCHVYIVVLRIMLINASLTPVSYVLLLLYAVQNVLSSSFIIFASTMLRIITIRFAYLNQILDGYSYVQQSKLQRHFRHFGDTAFMTSFPADSLFVYRIHNRLLHIFKTTNECCSIILVGFMGYTFYTITTTTYNLFVEITAEKQISVQVLQWCLMWLALHVALLSILSRNCGQATREANTTSQILARVYGKTKEYQNIIDKFLTKSIKQEVQFTAYGFFVIDNSTLFKIFSAVTTYLVILIQFKQLEDSKMEDQLVAETV